MPAITFDSVPLLDGRGRLSKCCIGVVQGITVRGDLGSTIMIERRLLEPSLYKVSLKETDRNIFAYYGEGE